MSSQRIQDHYSSSGSGKEIAARIIAALRRGGAEPITPERLAPLDHFHGRGPLATQDLAAMLDPQEGETLLDIGCGIGGPARWIAEKYRCSVTGIDLTPEFCEAAREINDATGMSNDVSILDGSATALPLPDAVFDRAYSHNVLMNIADKAAVYREAFRVLKSGGRLVLFHVNAGRVGPLEYPQPWAAVPENSFLATDEETRRDLVAAGFRIETFRDKTSAHFPALAEARQKLETDGPPALGLQFLMGDRFLELQRRTMVAQEEGRIRPVEILAIKP